MSKVTFSNWNKNRVLADVSGRVVGNMEFACLFVEGQARANVARRSGRLQAGIGHEIKTEVLNIIGRVGVEKSAKAFYGLFVEVGTSTTPAKPFLRPALFNNLREIMRILVQ